MKIFKVNENISIVCTSENTRYGFRHLATLCLNGSDYDTAKCCYYNRTWEAFPYQTVILNLLDKTDALTKEEKEKFRSEIHG